MKIEIYSPTIRRKEMDAVLTAMVEDRIGPGEQARFLIQTAREKIRFDYCMALRSPAIALFTALKSLNLERGQGVLVSALSPLYYARVLEDLGLVPVYCDVLSSTTCMGRETAEKALASKGEGLVVRCVILHHTLGYPGNAAAFEDLGLPVIEDCSQSYGTVLKTDTETDGNPSVQEINTAALSIIGLEERDMLTSGGGALLYSMNRRDGTVLRGMGDLPPEYGLPDMNAAMAVV